MSGATASVWRPAAAKSNRDLSDTLAVYGAVAGAAGLPYGAALVVQYCAAVVGSITGLPLQ